MFWVRLQSWVVNLLVASLFLTCFLFPPDGAIAYSRFLKTSLAEATGVMILIAVVAWVLESLTYLIIPLATSEQTPRSSLGKAWYRRRLRVVQHRYESLRLTAERAFDELRDIERQEASEGLEEWVTLSLSLRQSTDLLNVDGAYSRLAQYPSQLRLAPTMLGNALRATEDRLGARYGMVVGIIRPRLEAVLPNTQRYVLQKALLTIFTHVRMATSCLFAASVVFIYGTIYFVTGVVELGTWLTMITGALGLIYASKVLYESSIKAAFDYGLRLEVAFDLHRIELLKHLSIAPPSNPMEERRIFELVTERLSGAEVHGLQFYYPESEDRVRNLTIMRDSYFTEQAMSVGNHAKARAEDVTFVKGADLDGLQMEELAIELGRLRAAVRTEPDSTERDSAVGALADAEAAAVAGDRSGVLANLKRAGVWVLGVADGIGSDVATAAIKMALGLDKS